MKIWKVGKVKITQLLEISVNGELDMLLPDAKPEVLLQHDWLFPDHVSPSGNLKLNIQTFAIETPSMKIIVDTCAGNGRKRMPLAVLDELETDFLPSLISAGFAPESVDRVVCTHLHADHVGWNTRRMNNKWVPTFPNARYLFGKDEFLNTAKENEKTPQSAREIVNAAVFEDSLKPVIDASLVELVESDHVICEEVSMFPTPGHTHGHVSILIRSEGEEAIITGDAIHHPCQLIYPQWCCYVDESPQDAIKSRLSMLERAVKEPSPLLIGTHFSGQIAGTIVRDKGTYRLV